MILPDVNVLIYAFRQDLPQHATSRSWLEDVVAGDARYGLSPLTLSALVRITTNPRTFVTPSSVEEAFGFCDDLLNQPHCEVIEPGDRHWNILRRLCLETGTRGAAITDAWFAALAIESGCDWITFDRDFARFPGLNWRRPG
ncbi:MAG TPA: type II toxin-antitoxin system VapC family toxin [Caulobacteraceae bacterium]|jgi:toxin-antitoxin system PIN domain toxin|nr:type II toxin-antitoxin system VapC family toxin [Caulobacteraceae bacterium]